MTREHDMAKTTTKKKTKVTPAEQARLDRNEKARMRYATKRAPTALAEQGKESVPANREA